MFNKHINGLGMLFVLLINGERLLVETLVDGDFRDFRWIVVL